MPKTAAASARRSGRQASAARGLPRPRPGPEGARPPLSSLPRQRVRAGPTSPGPATVRRWSGASRRKRTRSRPGREKCAAARSRRWPAARGRSAAGASVPKPGAPVRPSPRLPRGRDRRGDPRARRHAAEDPTVPWIPHSDGPGEGGLRPHCAEWMRPPERGKDFAATHSPQQLRRPGCSIAGSPRQFEAAWIRDSLTGCGALTVPAPTAPPSSRHNYQPRGDCPGATHHHL